MQMIREFYRTTVVQVGFSCDYVMRIILAISSLHLAHHRPQMLEHYQSIAIVHYQVASRAVVPLIPDVTPGNGQMLFLFSVLMTYYGEILANNKPCLGKDILSFAHHIVILSPRLAPQIQRLSPPRRYGLSRVGVPATWDQRLHR